MAVPVSFRPARHVFILLMALLIAMRGAVAQGYMLDRSAEDGTITIRMCGGLETRLMRFDPETGALSNLPAGQDDVPDQPPPSDEAPGESCAFALGATTILPAPPAGPGLPLDGPPLLAGKPLFDAPKPRAEGPSLPPRGPPVLTV